MKQSNRSLVINQQKIEAITSSAITVKDISAQATVRLLTTVWLLSVTQYTHNRTIITVQQTEKKTAPNLAY